MKLKLTEKLQIAALAALLLCGVAFILHDATVFAAGNGSYAAWFGLTPVPQQSGTNELINSLENYGLIGAPTFTDVTTIVGSGTITSVTANFVSTDVGLPVLLNGFAPGTTISSVSSGSVAVLSSTSTLPIPIGSGTASPAPYTNQTLVIEGRQATPLNLHGGSLTLGGTPFSTVIFGTGTLSGGSVSITNSAIVAGQNVFTTPISGGSETISATCATGTMTFTGTGATIFSYMAVH